MNSHKLTKSRYAYLQLRKGAAVLLCLAACFVLVRVGYSAETPNPLVQEFSITVDPTALVPSTSWQVPGVTPLIYTMDPITSEAYSTAVARALNLHAGEYRFGTYTFDFSFTVSREGLLQFAPSLNHCVKGRGTRTLTVLCRHTQPYPQQPDY